MQLEEQNVGEAEVTTLRIIFGQSFVQNGTEEELTVQLGFASVIRCHDPFVNKLLNQAVAKHRSI